MKTKTKTKGAKAVVICTLRRGVFFGNLERCEKNATEGWDVTLRGARQCLYWDAATKGVLGLASDGPGRGCRVGPLVPRHTDTAHAVIECTSKAVARWVEASWTS